MKEEIAKKWVEALRSNEFNQGRGRLCQEADDGDYFCCLGILAELYCQEVGSSVWEKYAPRGMFVAEGELAIHGNVLKLPPGVMDWAGMKTHDGDYKKDRSLSMDNDAGKSFKQIANTINTHWKKL